MIPGPVSVSNEVLAEMGSQVTAHYGKKWVKVHNETVSLAKRVFQTNNDLFVIVGSGTTSLEAALGSVASDQYEAFVPINGGFARRLFELLSSHMGRVKSEEYDLDKPIPADELGKILGKNKDIKVVATVHCESHTGVINPIKEFGEICKDHDCILMVDAVSSLGGIEVKTDEWNIDLCVTASQKALEAPPGLSLVSVSPKAWKLVESNQDIHGWYLNLNVWKEYAEEWKDWHPFPTTMAVNNVLALRRSLKNILEEGLANRFERHKRVAKFFRKAMKNLGFEIFADDEYASNTVTSVKVGSKIDANELIDFLQQKHSIKIAGGVRDLKGKVFRVGHMGPGATYEAIIPVIFAIEDALNNAGQKVKIGESIKNIEI